MSHHLGLLCYHQVQHAGHLTLQKCICRNAELRAVSSQLTVKSLSNQDQNSEDHCGSIEHNGLTKNSKLTTTQKNTETKIIGRTINITLQTFLSTDII